MMIDSPPAAVAAPAYAHASATFEVKVALPMPQAMTLFGPERERVWAGKDWDPHFLYPSPPADQNGAVFTVLHGDRSSIWVTSQHDPARGYIQYVVFQPGLMTTTIDIWFNRDGNGARASVTYTRTALSPEANEHVPVLIQGDRQKGPEWESQIAAYLRAGGH